MDATEHRSECTTWNVPLGLLKFDGNKQLDALHRGSMAS